MVVTSYIVDPIWIIGKEQFIIKEMSRKNLFLTSVEFIKSSIPGLLIRLNFISTEDTSQVLSLKEFTKEFNLAALSKVIEEAINNKLINLTKGN